MSFAQQAADQDRRITADSLNATLSSTVKDQVCCE
jgi:hypothetical protein